MTVQVLGLSGLTALLLLVVGFWIFHTSPEDLLDFDALTPAQIRTVAESCLLHPEMETQVKAHQKLVSLGDTAVPPLKEVGLSNSDVEIKIAVLSVLRVTAPEVGVEIVDSIGHDPDSAVRGAVLQEVVRLRHPRAAEILQKALNDPDAGVRNSAAGLLSQVEGKGVVSSLEKVLKNDPDLAVRQHAARSLQQRTGRDHSNLVSGAPRSR